MLRKITKLKYSRSLNKIPVNGVITFIKIASLNTVEIYENEDGSIISENVNSGPSDSVESNIPFKESNVSYELTIEEFDELINLHQKNKKEFLNYVRS